MENQGKRRGHRDFTAKFDLTKRPKSDVRSEFTKLQKRLQISGCDCRYNTDALSSPEAFEQCNVMVFISPEDILRDEEMTSMKKFLSKGGSLLFLGAGRGDGEKNKSNKCVNEFLKDYGIQMENECVIRTAFHNKYLHPKHSLITNGCVHPALDQERQNILTNASSVNQSLQKQGNYFRVHKNQCVNEPFRSRDELVFVYPFGTTLSVQHPGLTILSSGPISFPINRPVAAVWEDESKKLMNKSNNGKQTEPQGRILVMGSKDLLSDEWIEKEENGILADIVFNFLLRRTTIYFDRSQCQTELLEERRCIPDIGTLSQQLRSCFQGTADPLPQDFSRLFILDKLFKFDRNLIPECIDMYEKLDVKREPLSLIPPEFSCPFPSLQPACYHPRMPSMPPPALELFDIDEQFASDAVRLAQLTNKCKGDEDLENYILEAADALGVDRITEFNDGQSDGQSKGAKKVLDSVFRQIAEFKMRLTPSYDPSVIN